MNHPATLSDMTDFEVRYWFEVDHNHGRNAAGYYLTNGDFHIGDRVWSSQHEIEGFYAERKRLGPRTARHVVTNFVLLNAGTDRARFQCILTLTAADGLPPLPADLPVMIADIIADVARTEEGSWKFMRHRLIPIFVGKSVPALGAAKK